MPIKKKRPRRKSAPASLQKRLVDITLRLIEKNNGCRGVNLRQIAAQARCAHTNVYNYFDSLEKLFWAALDVALQRLMDHTFASLQNPAAKSAPLRHFIETQLDYSLAHPAHYRLFWLEPLSGKPSPQIMKRLEEMRVFWTRLIAAEITSTTKNALSEDALIWAGQLIHGYFHGEVCKLVGRKEFVTTSADVRGRIIGNTLSLVKMIGLTKSKE
ncbi:MAG: TetR/AcrR family transcriptional regulator [Nibricoccus sp.]